MHYRICSCADDFFFMSYRRYNYSLCGICLEMSHFVSLKRQLTYTWERNPTGPILTNNLYEPQNCEINLSWNFPVLQYLSLTQEIKCLLCEYLVTGRILWALRDKMERLVLIAYLGIIRLTGCDGESAFLPEYLHCFTMHHGRWHHTRLLQVCTQHQVTQQLLQVP